MNYTTEPADIAVELRRWARAHGQPNITISKTGKMLWQAADVIEAQRDLLAEVLACIDENDYLALTMMFPRLKDAADEA